MGNKRGYIAPSRQLERSARAVAKQRAALQDIRRPSDAIRKPYRMKTREFERRLAILQKHERKLRESLARYMGLN